MYLGATDLREYQGFLFDMDGTLVNSETAVRLAVKPWCDKHNVCLETILTVGRGARFIDFIARYTPHLDLEEEVEKLERAEANLAHTVTAIAGARRVLDYLNQHNLSWAIATSANKPNALARLCNSQLPIPSVLITAEDVQNGKPDPMPFILAARQLGIAPQQCVAFEDSDQGVKSALAAGCDVVIINHYCTLSHENIISRINDFHPLTFDQE